MTVHGPFDRGDAVQVEDGDGQVVGFGLTNYAAADVQRLRGVHSSAIQATLGYYHGDEVIHRDNLVIAGPEEDSARSTL